MLPEERKQQILSTLQREHKVHVGALSERFRVTEETIRRDLEKLEREGWLKRTYGGAVLRREGDSALPYWARETLYVDHKRRIAQSASALVEDGMTIMIDAGTTTFELMGALRSRRNVTVVTNSARITAGVESDATLLCCGGELLGKSLAFVGPIAESCLARFHADIAFIGAMALDAERGLMEANIGEAEIKRVMKRHAECTVLLADASKFDGRAPVQVGPLSMVDVLVSDRLPNEEWRARLETAGTQLRLVD
ncbi:DeoR/GlpR family DNA-binding transcription regulator [Halotalea alkalilenta]|uniref:HTH deoR-type domain-containing protein n=1 Tax=Halotalea alkalilenta TaxID=376489 RepID=A0A172YF03_9GAMM|nr:DeoR/GlpR family DNA-binding transcription regulator [Halotalea alkalilenta]ANF57662.1 hypothetical protein A5892_09465 [Halotalea alkalilenta]